MLFDTHAHVNFKSFKDDAKETLQRALDAGVWVINVGSQIDTSRQAVELASQYKEGVYAVVGLHPEHTHSQYVDEEETHFLTREEDFDTKAYRSIMANPKVVGVGECGLDYYRIKNQELGIKDVEDIKQKQRDAFIKQIQISRELDKVLVVHSRSSKGTDDAVEDIYGILKQETYSASSGQASDLPHRQAGKEQELRFVAHSYTGSPEYLQKFLELGAFVSFNGIITFDKTGNMEKLVQLAPLEKIILETDCPYLAPPPFRGKRNEPMYVKYVAEKLAQIKNLSLDEVAEITTNNARKLFGI